MQILDATFKAYGLKINLKKTKFMRKTKSKNVQAHLVIDGTLTKRAEHHKYLGSWLIEMLDQSTEIWAHIEMARVVCINIKNILCSRNIN